jgi:hypothetical protein
MNEEEIRNRVLMALGGGASAPRTTETQAALKQLKRNHGDRSGERPAAANEVDDDQHDPDQEQNPGDLAGDRSDPKQAERTGYESDDKKDQRVVQHLETPPLGSIIHARGLPSGLLRSEGASPTGAESNPRLGSQAVHRAMAVAYGAD